VLGGDAGVGVAGAERLDGRKAAVGLMEFV